MFASLCLATELVAFGCLKFKMYIYGLSGLSTRRSNPSRLKLTSRNFFDFCLKKERYPQQNNNKKNRKTRAELSATPSPAPEVLSTLSNEMVVFFQGAV